MTICRCLLLCLPALIVGFILRVSFITAIPEAYYASDSSSSFSTVRDLYQKGRLKIEQKRRWLYPLLLVPLPKLPGNTPQAVALIQHAVGLLTIVGIGWITGQLSQRPAITVPLATMVAAIWPKALWYEHEMIAETFFLAAFVFAIGAALPAGALRDRRRLLWFLLLAAIVASLKPSGKPVWLALVGAAIFLHWPVWKWKWYHGMAGALGLILVITGGSDRQSGWLLFSSALPFVNTQGETLKEYREILRPHVEKMRQNPWAHGLAERYWKLAARDDEPLGLFGPRWAELVKDREKHAAVMKQLAVEAVLHHPLGMTEITLSKIAVAASDNQGPGIVPTDNATARPTQPKEFWILQERTNTGRWSSRPDEMKLLYEMDEPAYTVMTRERATRRDHIEPLLRAFNSVFIWAFRVKAPDGAIVAIWPAWLGVLAFAGGCITIFQKRKEALLLLTVPAVLYLIVAFGVGDAVVRYFLTVEWIGIILAVLVIDRLFMIPLGSPKQAHSAAPPANVL